MPRSRNSWALLLFERGLSIPIPGLGSVPAGLFPVWADYRLLDFQLATFAALGDVPATVIVCGATRDAGALLAAHTVGRTYKTIELEGSDLRHLIDSMDADSLLVSSTAQAAIFDPSTLTARAPREVVKVSVDSTPLELYAVRKRTLLSLLKADPTYRDRDPVDVLFDSVLLNAFSEIREFPGRILYSRDLTAFYRANLRLASEPLDETVLTWRSVLDRQRSNTPPSYVAPSGEVVRSHLGSGVEVSGRVSGSVLFEGVSIAEGATVRDSVVMSHNRIGRGADIRRTLVLPNVRRLRSVLNVEEKVTVGGPSTGVKNSEYSSQIYDGLTVLGMGVEVPRGVSVDQGCYVAGGYSPSRLKRLRRLPQGETYLAGSDKNG